MRYWYAAGLVVFGVGTWCLGTYMYSDIHQWPFLVVAGLGGWVVSRGISKAVRVYSAPPIAATDTPDAEEPKP
jgi:hypothetical protein